MHLDILTLTIAGAFVAFLSSLLIAGAWTQIRSAPALLWWAAATLLNACGIALVALGQANAAPLATLVGVGAFIASPGLIWGGIRRFAGRSAPIPVLLAGLAAWLAVSFAPFPESRFIGTLLSFASTVVYLAAAIGELWRGRAEWLPARWALTGIFTVHILTFVGGIADSIEGRVVFGGLPPLNSWFGIINFESLLFSISSALFMVLLAKERREQQYVVASRQDSMTGIANRGALLETAGRMLRRCQQEGRSFSLIMFDLDRFKNVNDTFGHAAGDDVIRHFARTAEAFLRPNDFFGRYGGEEFVVALPNATIEAAYVIADRIRNAVANSPTVVDSLPTTVTVSAGVASATSSAHTLEAIMKSADDCLYRAKELGRNRVERPAREPDTDEAASHLIRIA